MKKEYTIGYFLNERHIDSAFKLLKKQIEQTSPLYNTLDFKIYREERKIDSFNSKTFYNNFIKNDTLYYFKNQFYVLDFLGVQSAYKNRKYHFLSFESLILFNAVGLYIQELLTQYQTDFDSILNNSNGKTFYGGRLNYEKAESSTIFYYDDYQKFLTAKEKLTKPSEGKVKYVLTVDIQAFFYSIDHKKLLSIIDNNATNIAKKSMKYDENTVASIDFLLKYFMNGEKGIPVASQNIVASYLSSVFFSPFDQYVVDTYLSKSNISYIRYVDDFYLIYEVPDSELASVVRNEIYTIENDISDFLSNELGLTVSTIKSKRTKIDSVQSYFEFLTVSHTTSPNEQELVGIEIRDIVQERETEGKNAPTIFKECIDIVSVIKKQLNDYHKIEISKKDSNYLNNILINPTVLSYSKSAMALSIIREEEILLTYESFDYLLVKLKVLLHLITIQPDSRTYFHSLLLKECSSSVNINQKLMLIERFILQLEFVSFKDSKEKIISKADIQFYKGEYRSILSYFTAEKPNNTYCTLLNKMLNPNIILIDFKPMYGVRFLNKLENSSLLQQIKQRHLNEKLGFFNVAFNHLLNEFQNIVEAAYFNRKDKNALEIRDKLAQKGFKTNDVLFVSDFFKRRNQNSISHTNHNELGFWGVSEKEYFKYKKRIIPLIKIIFKKIK
ncbi:hypothetical protein DNU06_15535 [Putridiphycobacter roseus]|uniref:Uncharacterized protein n=1 Tax=Putridiphycobacter roseus TaxID=2219161 RepID=A0A2W1MV14_9FLAO|nr:reverse transcriptase domain-containing protein [Putridiphycobacter roseus]PZE15919.1 hypothetical protein DNU06_15535 [Putridiphycobacter roseus]